MLKSFALKLASIFGQRNAELSFVKITEDKYDTYGIGQILHRESVNESAAWIKQYIDTALFFNDKRRMFKYVSNLLKERDSEDSLFLEFGVQTGTSINALSSNLSATMYGFDTFEGMPEDWTGWNVEKGQFSMGGNLPPVNKNVVLIKGLIQDTLTGFLQSNPDKKIAFIHIDTDTYSAAKVILNLCKSRFTSGTLILFDELHSYTSWRLHEYKALKEELNDDSYFFKAFSDRKQGLIEIK